MNKETVDLITVMTYCVVLFSIVVQGLTIKGLFEKAAAADPSMDTKKKEEEHL